MLDTRSVMLNGRRFSKVKSSQSTSGSTARRRGSNMKIRSRVALITGAGSGIGKQAALALAAAGWAIVLAGRQREPLEATAAEVEKLGGRGLAVPTDVGKPAGVKALFARTKRAFGRLDVLFNNAGIFGGGALLEELTPRQWQQVVDINLTGSFLCTQEAFRLMKTQKPRGGRIINNGSISAHSPRPNSVAYTATKHAITGLTKSTSLDGRKYDIACSQIDIGNTATAMTRGMKKGMLQADGSIRPEPTFDVDHVGKAIVFIANLPLEANVQFLTIMATKMPFVGRG
jgi:NAD(P)-dependent dehydrogenase (short-subunit alcohol dehydrogenase family)